MDIYSVLTLIGGLAFFLYGMNVMSNGLEKMAGGKLEQILRKMTSNRFKGLILGAGVTAVIQSSSAVTVMLVGLVNSGVMQLSQAISVIMGSNIGTTMTAWILSLTGIESDVIWLNLLKPKNFTPVLAFIGIVMIMASKSQKKKDAGTILVGFSVLMYGMTIMSGAVEPLADMPQFTSMLTAFSNPILGVIVGMLFTAIIQSSSASVGVLQALSLTGAVTYSTAIPIILGQNIGTCISAILASIGTNKSAKRVATVHVLFNVIGTILFLGIWTGANAIFHFAFVNDAVDPYNIAVIHSIFNVFATFIMLPFVKALEKMACTIIKDGGSSDKNALLDERLMTVPAFAVAKAFEVTKKMADVSKESVNKSIMLMQKFSEKDAEIVSHMEGKLDTYEDELGTYLVKLSKTELSDKEAEEVAKMLHIISDFERIGDHADNMISVAREIKNKNIEFSHGANAELEQLSKAITEILDTTCKAFSENDVELAKTVEPLEQVIDTLINEIKTRHIKRLQSGNCTIEIGFVLTDMLTNFERISDHCSNIAVAVIESEHGTFDTHEYLNSVKAQKSGDFVDNYEKFLVKYSI